jgi:hypothetical protein
MASELFVWDPLMAGVAISTVAAAARAAWRGVGSMVKSLLPESGAAGVSMTDVIDRCKACFRRRL